jgi:5-dehydro-2-deoxygluconokinase
MSVDVLCMGRCGVDIYPLQSGVGLEDVTSFAKFVGGSAANVAVGLAGFGHSSALISKVGDDPFGTFVRRRLTELGVSDEFLGVYEAGRTPVTFTELFPPDDFPLYFYRYRDTPDLMITPQDIPVAEVESADAFWCTMTGLSHEPSRSAHFSAWQARSRKPYTFLDLDFRNALWPGGSEQAAQQAERAVPWCNIVIGNREEVEMATGISDPKGAAYRLIEMGAEWAIVKLGGDGVLALDGNDVIRARGFRVDVVNGLGAGDGFGAALVHKLLQRRSSMLEALRFANAVGALVTTQLACADAMPSEAQVDEFLANHPDDGLAFRES